MSDAGHHRGHRVVDGVGISDVGVGVEVVDEPAGVGEQLFDGDSEVVGEIGQGGQRRKRLGEVDPALVGEAVDQRSSEPGAVVAYPDAFGGAWNDGRPGADPEGSGVTVDDIRFLRLASIVRIAA